MLLVLLVLVLCQGMAPAPEGKETDGPPGDGVAAADREKAVSDFVDTFQARDIFWDWEWTPFIELEESVNDLKGQGIDTADIEAYLERQKERFKETKNNRLVDEAGEMLVTFRENMKIMAGYRQLWQEMKELIGGFETVFAREKIAAESPTMLRKSEAARLLSNPMKAGRVADELRTMMAALGTDLESLRANWREKGYRARFLERDTGVPENVSGLAPDQLYERVRPAADETRRAANGVATLEESESLYHRYIETMNELGFGGRMKEKLTTITRRYAFEEDNFYDIDKAGSIKRMVAEVKELVPPVVGFKLSLKGIMRGAANFASIGYRSDAVRVEGCQVLRAGDRFRDLVMVRDIGRDNVVLEYKDETYNLTLRTEDRIVLMLPYKEGE